MANPLRAAMRLLYNTLPAKQSLQLQSLKALGQWPDLDNPKTFNERVHALKLAARDPLMPLLADKVRVKEWVAERVGRDVVIPTLWTGTMLPEQPPCATPFIVKANHSSGWNHFVRTDDAAEWMLLRETSKKWLAADWHRYLHEWWYNEIDRLLLIEPIIGDNLNDYKFFCFNGEVKIVQVDEGRFTEHRRSFYDCAWQRQSFGFSYPQIVGEIAPPRHLARMIELAEILSVGFPFVRIDFYDLATGPKFGEMTFAPEAGFGRFSPISADRLLGDWWKEAAARVDARDDQPLPLPIAV